MIKILEKIGLSKNEAKIYIHLIEKGESSVSEISTGTNIYRRNVYDTIERLVDKGLCFPMLSSKENRYNAVDPGKLMEIENERRQELENMIPHLQKKFETRVVSDEAYIFRGLEGQKNIWREILNTNQPVYHIGAKGQWFDPQLETTRKAFHAEAKRKKIAFNFLVDFEVSTNMPELIHQYPAELKVRILPKEFSTHSAINIFGDYICSYTDIEIKKMPEKPVFFIVRSAGLAESYRTWFTYMWDQSKDPQPIN